MDRRWLLLAAALLAGCSQASRVESEPEQVPKTDTNFARLPVVLEGIPKSGDVSLYEGLPSAFWEPELRERELNQRKTIKLHGYAFYDERVALPGASAGPVTAVFASKASFKRFDGKERCGGFYPEFVIEWKAGEAATQVLISLECGEVKMFGPRGELHCDLGAEAQQRLEQLLGPYRKNSPSARSNG